MACDNESTLREELLSMVNEMRQLPTLFGIRLYTVTVRVTSFTGGIFNVPGEGTKTVVETPIYLDGYTTLPKVTVLSTRDIIASGGLYTDGDYKIDFITPFYTDVTACPYGTIDVGGIAINLFDPTPIDDTVEIVYILTGPEFPTGALFKKIQTYAYKPFTYSIVVRKIGVQP